MIELPGDDQLSFGIEELHGVPVFRHSLHADGEPSSLQGVGIDDDL